MHKFYALLLGVFASCQAIGGPTRFHIKDLSQRNLLSLTVESPLEKVMGQCPLFGGWLELDLDKLESGIQGEIEFDLRSFNSGSGIRDALWQEKILESKLYPQATLKLVQWGQSVKGSLSKDKPMDFLVKAELRWRGKDPSLLVPVKLVYFSESEKTRARLPGNLLRLSGKVEVELAQMGISIPSDLRPVVGERLELVLDAVATDQLPNERVLLPEGPKPKERE